MSSELTDKFRRGLHGVAPDDPAQVTRLVDAILAAAREAGASDVHLVPDEQGLAMLWRIDGVLQPVDRFARSVAPNVVARLKVLAELLTYRTEVPQEGRIRTGDSRVEMRVSTFPTLAGEKAVVRLFVGSGSFRTLDDLGLPADIADSLKDLLQERGGLILLTGPAGSGKTTTVYAALRELAATQDLMARAPEARPTGRGVESGRSLVSIEDPVEAVLPGVAQSQVQPAAGFDYETGLRSLLRQDPDVILVGEIRDRTTAEVVFQASLTGHLVLTTFHAGSAAEALGRLADMGIEPYQLRSAILAIVSQRLLRRLCACATTSRDAGDRLGLDVEEVSLPTGCPACGGAGYRGRFVLAEMLRPDRHDAGRAILSAGDVREIESRAAEAGMATLWDRAKSAVREGRTSPAEVRRVFGLQGR